MGFLEVLFSSNGSNRVIEKQLILFYTGFVYRFIVEPIPIGIVIFYETVPVFEVPFNYPMPLETYIVQNPCTFNVFQLQTIIQATMTKELLKKLTAVDVTIKYKIVIHFFGQHQNFQLRFTFFRSVYSNFFIKDVAELIFFTGFSFCVDRRVCSVLCAFKSHGLSFIDSQLTKLRPVRCF